MPSCLFLSHSATREAWVNPNVVLNDSFFLFTSSGMHCACRHQTAHKLKSHIYTAPNTLTLHLKRFRPECTKLSGCISFPADLDLAPYMSPDSPDLQLPILTNAECDEDLSYKLYAVLLQHSSQLDTGGYCTYIIDSSGWLRQLVRTCFALLLHTVTNSTRACLSQACLYLMLNYA